MDNTEAVNMPKADNRADAPILPDRVLVGKGASDYLKAACEALEDLWSARKLHLDRGKTVPTELEHAYLSCIARVLYVGGHMDHQAGTGNIPPGVAIEAAHVIEAALKGAPSPALRPTGGSVPMPDLEVDQRIAAELLILAGYGDNPRWLALPYPDVAKFVAEKFGTSRTSVTNWVEKYNTEGVLRDAIEQRVAAGAFPTREAAAMHDLEVAAADYRSWRLDVQRRVRQRKSYR